MVRMAPAFPCYLLKAHLWPYSSLPQSQHTRFPTTETPTIILEPPKFETTMSRSPSFSDQEDRSSIASPFDSPSSVASSNTSFGSQPDSPIVIYDSDEEGEQRSKRKRNWEEEQLENAKRLRKTMSAADPFFGRSWVPHRMSVPTPRPARVSTFVVIDASDTLETSSPGAFSMSHLV